VGENIKRVRSIDPFGTAFGRVLSVAVVIVSFASYARGVGVALFAPPRERALGVDRTWESLWREPPADGATVCRVEAGEWLLFGIDGLHAQSLGLTLERKAWDLEVSAALLAAPVGRESAFGAEASAPFGGRFRIGAAVRADIAEIDGCEAASLVMLSVSALVPVGGGVALFSRAEDIRLAGEPLPGAGATIGLAVSGAPAVGGTVRLALSPAGAVSFGVSSRVRVGGRLYFSLGYEDDSGSFNGSVCLRVKALLLDAGSAIHPVLGVSQGLFLSFGKGW
jgi:hypothetical protein